MFGLMAYGVWFIFIQKQERGVEAQELGRVSNVGGGALEREGGKLVNDEYESLGGMSVRGLGGKLGSGAPGGGEVLVTQEPRAEAVATEPPGYELERPAWPQEWYLATAMPDPMIKVREDLEGLGRAKEVWISIGNEIGRYSYYWPPLGGINCAGDCDITASGKPWIDYVGWGVACPVEIDFGTWVRWKGGEAMCIDRGGRIVRERDGGMWFDFLREKPELRWGTLFTVELGRYVVEEVDW